MEVCKKTDAVCLLHIIIYIIYNIILFTFCSLVYIQRNHLAWCIRIFVFNITNREKIFTIEKVSCFEKGSSIYYNIQVNIIDYILQGTL